MKTFEEGGQRPAPGELLIFHVKHVAVAYPRLVEIMGTGYPASPAPGEMTRPELLSAAGIAFDLFLYELSRDEGEDKPGEYLKAFLKLMADAEALAPGATSTRKQEDSGVARGRRSLRGAG